MMAHLFRRVVLTEDVPEAGLRAGDVGVVVDEYPADGGRPAGLELEFFSPTDETVAVVSVAASGVREATGGEVLSARVLVRA